MCIHLSHTTTHPVISPVLTLPSLSDLYRVGEVVQGNVPGPRAVERAAVPQGVLPPEHRVQRGGMQRCGPVLAGYAHVGNHVQRAPSSDHEH